MTPDTKELRRLLQILGPMDWFTERYGGRDAAWRVHALTGEQIAVVGNMIATREMTEARARFIAAAHNALPALLDAYEERERLRDNAENALIAFSMGWDLDGVMGELRAALEGGK